jgi:predicted DNA-binding transcriptional regulator AlpA
MQSNLQEDDPILTTSEVARLLGVATSTVQIWMESGAVDPESEHGQGIPARAAGRLPHRRE